MLPKTQNKKVPNEEGKQIVFYAGESSGQGDIREETMEMTRVNGEDIWDETMETTGVSSVENDREDIRDGAGVNITSEGTYCFKNLGMYFACYVPNFSYVPFASFFSHVDSLLEEASERCTSI